jgi:hypothetical protein
MGPVLVFWAWWEFNPWFVERGEQSATDRVGYFEKKPPRVG